MWENLLYTAVDCEQITDAIAAYHRLIDLKSGFIDSEVVRRIVDYILGHTKELDEKEFAKVNCLQKLFHGRKRITFQNTQKLTIIQGVDCFEKS